MIEPTESEPKGELDRFCDALIAIRKEIQAVLDGQADAKDNVLKNAPHTADAVTADAWSHPYSREQAAYPLPWVRANKVWPSVSRIDNPYGDRNLICACPPMEATMTAEALSVRVRQLQHLADDPCARQFLRALLIELEQPLGHRARLADADGAAVARSRPGTARASWT